MLDQVRRGCIQAVHLPRGNNQAEKVPVKGELSTRCRGRINAAFLACDRRQTAEIEVSTVGVEDGVGVECNMVNNRGYRLLANASRVKNPKATYLWPGNIDRRLGRLNDLSWTQQTLVELPL